MESSREQSSLLSFSLYIIDGLFEKLEKNGMGCHMGNHYTGGIGYVDDLTLLTPTRSRLKVLIKICKQYAEHYCVKFNSAKSKYLVLEVAVVNSTTEQLFLMAPSCRVFRMLYIWATVYPLLIRIAYSPMAFQHSGEGTTCSWVILVIWPLLQCKLFKQYCCSYCRSGV